MTQHPYLPQSFRSAWPRWLVVCSIILASCLTSPHPARLWAQIPTPNQSPAATGVLAGETIVYIKANRELRLIQPDGSDDRLLWRMPEGAAGEIESVAWRPDAQQIAFVSSHEATCSEWVADIYLINPDGSGLRRLTNGPACGELAAYPQGSATVQIENLLSNVNQVLVYIEGAPTAQVVNIAPGSTVLVTFPQVADLGDGLSQSVVVIDGYIRWFSATVQADVMAGENAHAGKLSMTGAGFDAFGAFGVNWNPAGTRLAYQFGSGRLWQVGLTVPLLGEGGPLLDPQTNNSVLGSFPIWSPIDNRVLYQRNDSSPRTISQAEVDSNDPGTALVQVTLLSGISWLTDGSGFVAADYDALLEHTDLYLYKYSDESITQLTQTTTQAALYPKVSADSSQIMYTYIEDLQVRPLAPQLRIMNVDGSDDHLLVDGGVTGDWSRVAPQNPPATPQPTPTATPQGQPTPTATPPGQPTITTTPQGQTTPIATLTPGSMPYSLFLPNITR